MARAKGVKHVTIRFDSALHREVADIALLNNVTFKELVERGLVLEMARRYSQNSELKQAVDSMRLCRLKGKK